MPTVKPVIHLPELNHEALCEASKSLNEFYEEHADEVMEMVMAIREMILRSHLNSAAGIQSILVVALSEYIVSLGSKDKVNLMGSFAVIGVANSIFGDEAVQRRKDEAAWRAQEQLDHILHQHPKGA